jgi:hypothetical protein
MKTSYRNHKHCNEFVFCCFYDNYQFAIDAEENNLMYTFNYYNLEIECLMMRVNPVYWSEGSITIRRALYNSLEFLDNSAKNALLYHITHKYGVLLDDLHCSSISQIHKALEEMLGPAAANIIMHHFHGEYRSTP